MDLKKAQRVGSTVVQIKFSFPAAFPIRFCLNLTCGCRTLGSLDRSVLTIGTSTGTGTVVGPVTQWPGGPGGPQVALGPLLASLVRGGGLLFASKLQKHHHHQSNQGRVAVVVGQSVQDSRVATRDAKTDSSSTWWQTCGRRRR
jgi:hypothetical protein